MFREKFSDQYSLPDSTILVIITHFHTHFTVGRRAGSGRKSSVTLEKWEKEKDCAANNPRVSLHRPLSQVGMSRMTIHCTLHALKLKPYHISVRHELKRMDPAKRIAYCTWFETFTHNNANHLDDMCFSDKTWVHLDVYMNSQVSDMVRRQPNIQER